MAERPHCIFRYLYRDASNFKTFGLCLCSGEAHESDDGLVRAALLDGEFFIPEQVGLQPLQFRLREFSDVPTADDHVWHTFVDVRPATDAEIAQFHCQSSKRSLLAALQTVGSWDERQSQIYSALVANFVLVDGREIATD